MDYKIASRFSAKLNKISEIQTSILEELRFFLFHKGEQGFLCDDDTNFVSLYYLNDDNDEGIYKVDKIKIDSDGIIRFHDMYFDDWHRLSELRDNEVNTLVEYIDWK